MASRAPSKSTKKKAKTPASRAAKPAGKPAGARQRPSLPTRPTNTKTSTYVPRAVPVADDDDVLIMHGAGGGAGFGRCGGRVLGSRLEQNICDRLSQAGVAHSHSPRHYEVTLPDGKVGAYAPMLVLRGRGREGKSVVIESTETADSPILKKIVSFRSQYGQEFYIILVAPEDLLDEIELATFDESCSTTNVNTLVARLAE